MVLTFLIPSMVGSYPSSVPFPSSLPLDLSDAHLKSQLAVAWVVHVTCSLRPVHGLGPYLGQLNSTVERSCYVELPFSI